MTPYPGRLVLPCQLTRPRNREYITPMPRRPRQAMGGLVYHVLNRAVGRTTLFDTESDYAAFIRCLNQSQQRLPTRLLAYCIMPNHFHLVLWPRKDDELSQWMRWLTVTHTQRWHAHKKTSGTGPIYQGRFKSFPVQSDEHLLTVLRYVERNPLRANLSKRAEDWPWSSLFQWHHRRRTLPDHPPLATWPLDRPRNWLKIVNRPETQAELESLQTSITRSRPFGNQRWTLKTADRLQLQSTLHPIGRPRKDL